MTRIRRVTAAAAALAIVTAAALLAVGCGGTSEADPTPVRTFKITPAADATAAPAATPAAEPTKEATSVAGAPLTLVGINNTFEPEELGAPAGSVTIEFDNRDGGVVHNVHVFDGDEADDETLAETELEVGPVIQTLTFDAEPGEYFFQCDAHPTTMTGTLTVS